MAEKKIKYSIIIPAYNEEGVIKEILSDLIISLKEFPCEIIVVDDGSIDHTKEIVKSLGVKIITHIKNKGYGASLKTGVHNAKGEYVLFMDADGQHNGKDALILIENLNRFDMVVGQRTQFIHSPLWRMPGKWLLLMLSNYLSRVKIPDLNSGLRLIKANIVRRYMHLCPNGFSFSTTITLILFNRGYEIKYAPFEIKKTKSKSTVSIATGFDTILLILRLATLIDPLRVFIPLSLIIGLIGIAWGIPYALLGNGISTGSMLAIVTAILLFSIGLISDQISQLRLENL